MSYNDSIAKGVYNLNIKSERYSKQYDTLDDNFINKYSEDVDNLANIISKLYEQSFAYVAVKINTEGEHHEMKIDVFVVSWNHGIILMKSRKMISCHSMRLVYQD